MHDANVRGQRLRPCQHPDRTLLGKWRGLLPPLNHRISARPPSNATVRKSAAALQRDHRLLRQHRRHKPNANRRLRRHHPLLRQEHRNNIHR